jgi:hypothetical protein
MAASTERRLDRVLITMNILAIVGAAGWTVFIYRHKEVILPSRLPLNVVMTATATPRASTSNLVPVEILISVANRGSRPAYMGCALYMVTGLKLRATRRPKYSDAFVPLFNDALRRQQAFRLGKYVELYGAETVEIGSVFHDHSTWLEPNEELSYQVTSYVPDSFAIMSVFGSAQWAATELDIRRWTIELEGQPSCSQQEVCDPNVSMVTMHDGKRVSTGSVDSEWGRTHKIASSLVYIEIPISGPVK